ncbi:MAG: hypothetical protein JWM38_2711 [Sphingomonas bacterium]|nr:hypothetical protein [Sphingomonas bacterium]MDB5683757.1 hypothetical protein [Sphingomonas bacterium]MDB5719284.1 hypothetical protein [Sphingomonas bacterium]
MIHASLRAIAASKSSGAARLPEGGPAAEGDYQAELREQWRAEALWATAPWLAALSLLCAAVVALAITRDAPPPWLGGWLALLVASSWTASVVHRQALNYPLGRIGRWRARQSVSAFLLALAWGVVPAWTLGEGSREIQTVLGAATATMIAGAFLMAVAPAAATIWAATLSACLVWSQYPAGPGLAPLLAVLLTTYVAVILVGCRFVARLIARHAATAERERAQCEAVSLLLREYEEQGAGWLWQVDAVGLFTYVSPHISHMLGRATVQMLGQPLPAAFGQQARLGAAMAAREAFAGIEIKVTTASGPKWLSLSGTPIVEAGGFRGFRGVGADITEVHRSQERLTRMARNDTLTGLPNRHRVREILAEAIGTSQHSGVPCALLFLDLDGFKPVNDTFGHPIGDAVLRTVGERLSAAVAERGVVGRVGGDEFAAVLHDGRDRAAVAALGDALIAAVSAPYRHDKGEVRIGLSIGVAFAPDDGTTVEELLLKADLALYTAKSQGRGRCREFEPEMQRIANMRADLEQALRQALQMDQLSLHYQPVLDSRSQAILGFEALLRWDHPDHGSIPPSDFLGIAEETGLIAEIGDWVLRTACRDASAWPDGLFVAVNLSPRQAGLAGLSTSIAAALTMSGLKAGRLHLEVTEQLLLNNSDDALNLLRRLKTIGVAVVLDDFGIGHSAFGHLAAGVFDTVKIDGSFVRRASDHLETMAILRATIAVANSFQMQVIAEGIEVPHELHHIASLGCSAFQGALAAAPMPYDETLALIRSRRTGAAAA